MLHDRHVSTTLLEFRPLHLLSSTSASAQPPLPLQEKWEDPRQGRQSHVQKAMDLPAERHLTDLKSTPSTFPESDADRLKGLRL